MSQHQHDSGPHGNQDANSTFSGDSIRINVGIATSSSPFQTPSRSHQQTQFVSSLSDAFNMPPPSVSRDRIVRPSAGYGYPLPLARAVDHGAAATASPLIDRGIPDSSWFSSSASSSIAASSQISLPSDNHASESANYNLSLHDHKVFSQSSSESMPNVSMPYAWNDVRDSLGASTFDQVHASSQQQTQRVPDAYADVELNPSWLLAASSETTPMPSVRQQQNASVQTVHAAFTRGQAYPSNPAYSNLLLGPVANQQAQPLPNRYSMTPRGPREAGAVSGPYPRPMSESRMYSSAFLAFRDTSAGDYTPQQEVSMVPSTETLSPASAVSLSPIHLSSAFPPGMNDRNFLRAVFEQQQTPSTQSTSLPPDGTIGYGISGTDQFLPTVSRHASSASLLEFGKKDQPSRSFRSLDQAERHSKPVSPSTSESSLRPLSFSEVQQGVGSASSRNKLFTAPRSSARKGSSRPTSASSPLLSTQHVSLASPRDQLRALENSQSGLRAPAASRPSSEWSISGTSSTHSEAGLTSTSAELAGLGLNLTLVPERDQEMVEQLIPEVAKQDELGDTDLQCDEMGRLFFAPMQRRGSSTGGSTSSIGMGSVSSLSRMGGWHSADRSWATADTSFVSTNSSSLELSLQDDPTPLKQKWQPGVGTPSISPNPSIRRSEGQLYRTNVYDTSAVPMLEEAPRGGQMHDFSEFGQSVPIDLMAEDRWRTWPRNRPGAVGDSLLSVGGSQQTGLESLDAGTSASHSRLLAEPYTRTQRSGRPSSSTSTSSRGSPGAIAGLDMAATLSSAGPTRPRSTLLTTTSARTPSARTSMIEKSSLSSLERKSFAVSELRRARGLSQGSFPANAGRMMEMSRSTDSAEPKRANLVGMARVTSMDDGTAARQAKERGVARLADTAAVPLSSGSSKGAGKAKSKVGYNEVSVALDTLRMFLHQKDRVHHMSGSGDSKGGATPAGISTSQKAPSEAAESVASSDTSSISGTDRPARTLRRTKGTLPPRGSINFSEPADASSSAPTARHTHSLSSVKASGRDRSSPSSGMGFGSSREEDRLAVLQDLSDRVRQLKQASEASSHQRTQSAITPSRREIHERYLRKRRES